jgi:starch synthase (maltosyl-transferring)
MSEGLRIYNLFPTLAGTIRDWVQHLPRIAAMRFNAVYVNPFHYPGFSGSLYAVKDYYRLNPRFRADEAGDDDALVRLFTDAARAHGLRVIMDLVINHTARDSELVISHPHWFTRDRGGAVVSPYAIDPADPTRKTVWGDLAELDYRPPQRAQILAYFQELVRHYIGLGFGGFRCDAACKVPAEAWHSLIDTTKAVSSDVVFCAETVGALEHDVLALADAGFDYLFNSVKWWDFESPWLLEQYEKFRHIAPSIGFPESHDTDRLINELRAAGVAESEIEPRYRQAYALAAAFSAGVLLPMGFEYGWSRRLHVVGSVAPEPRRFDLSEFIGEVNATKQAIPTLNQEGPQRLLSSKVDALVALERTTESGGDCVYTILNTDGRQSHKIALDRHLRRVDDTLTFTDLSPGRNITGGSATLGPRVTVEPLDFRILGAARLPARVAADHHPLWPRDARIQIENVYPELDGGRYPVKRIIGDHFEVWADLFRDRHGKLRAVVRYRPAGGNWREAPLVFFDNDRWVARLPLDRVGRWHYTIEAWTDEFESSLDEGRRHPAPGHCAKAPPVVGPRNPGGGPTKSRRPLQHRIPHRGEVAGRGVDDAQNLGRRGLSGRCLVALCCALGKLVLKIVDGLLKIGRAAVSSRAHSRPR